MDSRGFMSVSDVGDDSPFRPRASRVESFYCSAMQDPQQQHDHPTYHTFDALQTDSLYTNPARSTSPEEEVEKKDRSYTMAVGRHGLGVILLFLVVILWTSSNFLASVSRSSIHPFGLAGLVLNLSSHTGHLRRFYLLKAVLRDVFQ